MTLWESKSYNQIDNVLFLNLIAYLNDRGWSHHISKRYSGQIASGLKELTQTQFTFLLCLANIQLSTGTEIPELTNFR
jgi:hypothetical protein